MAAARSPAMAASALLHAGLLAAVILGLRKVAPPPLTLGAATPVSIVSEAPAAAEPAPTPAPERVEAQAPEPTPAPVTPLPEPAPRPLPTPPRPVAPTPPRPVAPAPAPPPPQLRPAPPAPATRPAPPSPRPIPTPRAAPPPKPTPAPRVPSLDLDALSRSLPRRPQPAAPSLDLNKLARNLPSSAPRAPSLDLDRLASQLPATARGPARPVAGPPAPRGLTGDVAGALRAKIQPRWNLNCDLEGADTVTLKVRFSVDSAGQLLGAPSTFAVTGEASEGAKAAFARGAEAAVRAAAPFTEVPAEQRKFMNPAILNFNAAQACRNR